jgi:tripartite-type tricarboxylate transporter receptor subunit TctC
MLFTSAVLAISPTLYASRMNFSPGKALVPISRVTSTPLVLLVHPGLPARSAQELIEIIRRRPTLLNAAINFTGSTSHLSAELLKQQTSCGRSWQGKC